MNFITKEGILWDMPLKTDCTKQLAARSLLILTKIYDS